MSGRAVGYIKQESYIKMKKISYKENENIKEVYNAIALDGNDIENIKIEGLKVVSKEKLIEKIKSMNNKESNIKN